MELREAEALRVLDYHHGGVRHVNAYLDHGRRDEHLNLARDEVAHHFVLLRGLHLSVNEPDREVREDAVAQVLEHACRVLQVHLLRLFDERVDDVSLSPGAHLALDAFINARALVLSDDDGLYRRPSGREFVYHRHVEFAVDGHRERARDGRRRHH